MEKKFKNKVVFTGPTPLRKAMVEELLKIGYKWGATSKDDYEEYEYTKTFYDVDFGKVGLGNSIKPRISCLTFTLPEQWDECLKACSEVEEEDREFVLPEKWYVAINNKVEGTVVANWAGFSWYNYRPENVDFISSNKEWWYTKTEWADSYTEITFEQFKKYVLKENNMKMEEFSIGGSLPLRKAFVEEGGFKVYSANTLSTEWNFLAGYAHNKDNLVGGNHKYPKHFELPKDWDAALEYAKLYFNQKEVKVFDLGNGYKAEVNLQDNTIKVDGKGIIKASDFVTWFDDNFSLAPLTTLSGYICKLSLSAGCLKKVDLDIVESIYNYISSNAQ